eukprot:scaffold19400_cov63-Phaeocystis_antarctica.AAC.2
MVDACADRLPHPARRDRLVCEQRPACGGSGRGYRVPGGARAALAARGALLLDAAGAGLEHRHAGRG